MKRRFLIVIISFLFSALSAPTSAESSLLEKHDVIEFAQLTKNLTRKSVTKTKLSYKTHRIERSAKPCKQIISQEKLYIKIRCLLI